MERIIVFEAGLQDHREYWLKEMSKSYELILLQPWLPTWEKSYISEYIECTFDKWEQELERLVRLFIPMNIKGVVCLNEGTVNFANDLQKSLKLPCIHSHHLPQALRNKKLMRQELLKSKLLSPKVYSDIHQVVFPVIVKPAEFMSSLGVSLVRNESELMQALKVATTIDIPEENLRTHYSLSSEVVIEEYIEGEEFSIECMVQKELILDIRITKKIKVLPPLFYETGHISNREFTEELLKRIHHYAKEVVKAFSLQNGLFHFEVMIRDKDIYTIELAARPGGDMIPYLYMNSEEMNYPRRVAEVFTDKKINPKSVESSESFAVYFPWGESFERTYLSEEVLKNNCRIISEKWIEKTKSADLSERLGEIILAGQYQDLLKLLNTLNQKCQHVV